MQNFLRFSPNSLGSVVMVTMSPDEHAISCVKGEFFIEIVEVTGGFATFSVMTTCVATLKFPNPIFFFIVVRAVHSRHHVVPWASEIEGLIILIHMSRPVAIIERSHLTAVKSVLTIFGTVVMPAAYEIQRRVTAAKVVEHLVVLVVVSVIGRVDL